MVFIPSEVLQPGLLDDAISLAHVAHVALTFNSERTNHPSHRTFTSIDPTYNVPLHYSHRLPGLWRSGWQSRDQGNQMSADKSTPSLGLWGVIVRTAPGQALQKDDTHMW